MGEQMTGLERKLWKGFRQLRRLGYFTKRDWLCCTPCCWSEVPPPRPRMRKLK
jgi:hypothetical protein